MLCRNCGTEIADKAIVCYRCGTGTTDPVRKPADIRRRRRGGLLFPLLGLIVLIGAALFMGEASRTATWWEGAGPEAWLAVVVVLSLALVVVLFRHFRR